MIFAPLSAAHVIPVYPAMSAPDASAIFTGKSLQVKPGLATPIPLLVLAEAHPQTCVPCASPCHVGSLSFMATSHPGRRLGERSGLVGSVPVSQIPITTDVLPCVKSHAFWQSMLPVTFPLQKY